MADNEKLIKRRQEIEAAISQLQKEIAITPTILSGNSPIGRSVFESQYLKLSEKRQELKVIEDAIKQGISFDDVDTETHTGASIYIPDYNQKDIRNINTIIRRLEKNTERLSELNRQYSELYSRPTSGSDRTRNSEKLQRILSEINGLTDLIDQDKELIRPLGEAIPRPDPLEQTYPDHSREHRITPSPYTGPVVFSGCDIQPIFHIGNKILAIGTLQALSYSIHRAKAPVRVLGRTYPKSYSRSGRSIAGTMVWAVFDQGAMAEVMNIVNPQELASDTHMHTFLPDQLPPFDITITYWSEVAGSGGEFRGSYLRLYGVDIIDEGQVHSIQDAYPENTMQFVARDIELMVPVTGGIRGTDGTFTNANPFQRAIFQTELTTASSSKEPVSQIDERIRELEERIHAMETEVGQMDKDTEYYKVSTYGNLINAEIERDRLVGELDLKKQELKKLVARREGFSTDNILRNDRSFNPYINIRDNPFGAMKL